MNDETEAEEVAVDPTPVEPVAVEVGISETKEVLEAFNVLAELLAKVFADGKLSGGDVFHVAHALKHTNVFVDAVKGASQVDDELKNLSQAELIELGTVAYELVKKVMKAVK